MLGKVRIFVFVRTQKTFFSMFVFGKTVSKRARLMNLMGAFLAPFSFNSPAIFFVMFFRFMLVA